MAIADKLKWHKLLWPDTLRGRLWILLVIVTVTPIVLIGITSYYWTYKAQEEKIGSNYQSMVDGKKESMDKVFANLSSVSQLLVTDGGLGDDIIDYLQTDDPVHKTEGYLAINKSLANIVFSSPNVSGLFFYFPSNESPVQFESAPLRLAYMQGNFRENEYPPFYVANQLSYHGPHPSAFANRSEPVFSLTRKIDNGSGLVYYIYVETQFDPAAKLPSGDSGESIKQLLVNSSNVVMYSQLDGLAAGSPLAAQEDRLFRTFKTFTSAEANGWRQLFLIPDSVYTKELDRWRIQFLLTALLSLVLTVFTVTIIWRMVYRPLNQMNKEFKRFGYNRSDMPRPHTRLQEFNSLFGSFQTMREKVAELLTEVEVKERRKAELEVEKLMSQINPHFLHNTLNTIQFLALEKGQKDIFNLVKVFTRVLQYNLKKNNMIVTIREEIGALEDYIELQNIRYDYRFDVRIEADPDIEFAPIPRFVLQPLVENALYHGLQSDQGAITVVAERAADGSIWLCVSDNGRGIAEEKIRQLLEAEGDRRSGLGIGLKYVRKMLEVYYGGEAEMTISSVIGEGTTIALRMPATLKGRDSDD
ncbi:sensor histidine kinase [Cohnella sp. 56]|uniref:sensor histidine kinase n=1 Tax=Cohnella sp. 56 TaxID=3113722 RepID=UPI0030EA6A03